MLSDLTALKTFILNIMTSVFNLYIGGSILTGFFALWLVRKVAKLFDNLF